MLMINMAVFGNEVLLCKVNSSEFLGLSAGYGENQVLVTNTHNTVTVYEVAPQKPTADFTTWRGHTLACSVIYSKKQKRYVSVLKNLSLRVWTQDETSISKGKNMVVPFDVDSLWSLCDKDPLVIFKNGAVCQLEESNTFSYLAQKTDGVVSLVCVRQSGHQTCVAYLSTTQKGMTCHCLVFSSEDAPQNVKHFVSSLPKYVKTPKGLCLLNFVENEIQILVLGNDGQLVSGTPNICKKNIVWKAVLKVDNFDNVDLMAVAFHKGYFVLAQLNEMGVIDCIAFSLKYQMQIHKKSMITAEKTEKVLSNCFSTLWYLGRILYEVGDRLFLAAGQEIFFMPFLSKPTKLAQIIGCKTYEQKENTVKGVNESISWTSNGLTVQDKLPKCDLDASKLQTPSFNDFLQLRGLQQSGTSDHVVSTQILSDLIKSEKFQVIGEVLSYYDSVPEAILVDILSSYIRYEDDRTHIISLYKNKKDFDELGYHPLIEQVVSMPVNDVFLLEQLRKIKVDEAIFLLRYLHRLLKQVNFVQEKNWTKILQWVEWTSTLLDAHFHQVIIFKNKILQKFLHEVMSTVDVQCDFLENLAALQGLIWISKCKSSDVDTWRNAHYCIESLEI